MKRCLYCGKPLSDGQKKYCTEDCRMRAHAFQHFADRKIYSFLLLFIVGTLGIVVGSVLIAMHPGIGTGIIGLSIIVWGVNFFILPFGIPDSLHFFGILASIRITRILSLLLVVSGIVLSVVGFNG